MRLYHEIERRTELNNFGGKEYVGIYAVKNVEKVHEEQSGHTGTYGEPCGMSWFVDRQGHVYTHLHTDGMGYSRDDDTVWWSSPLTFHSRDIFLRPLDNRTPIEVRLAT